MAIPGARRRLVAAPLAALAIGLCVGAATPLPAQEGETASPVGVGADTPADALPVEEIVLDNGMRLLALPRPGSPTVSVVIGYRVGGANEVPGRTGIVHLLEHLLFKGSTTVGTVDVEAERALFREMDRLQDSILTERAARAPDSSAIASWADHIEILEDSARQFVVPNEFDEILTRWGARSLNASTSADATSYYLELPANRLQGWFILEADRLANPVFREFYAERDVVMEERRTRIDTNPGGLLYETLLAAAFPAHPYGQPVAGYMDDLRTLTRPAVREYFRRYYGPRNATVALVGDLEPDSVRSWADRYFGRLEAGEPPPPVLLQEPEQRGERRVEVLWDAEPQLSMGWKVPAGDHDDAAAIAVLQAILTGGRSSRLHRRLVDEDRLATFVGSSIQPGFRYPGLLVVDAVPRSPHRPGAVEAAIREEVGRLRDEGPDPDEIERMRVQVRASQVRRLTSDLGLAFQLASSASEFGDWRETFRLSRELLAVTLEKVREVARRYLVDRRLTVGTLRREGEGR